MTGLGKRKIKADRQLGVGLSHSFLTKIEFFDGRLLSEGQYN